jgi:hypothetical protein
MADGLLRVLSILLGMAVAREADAAGEDAGTAGAVTQPTCAFANVDVDAQWFTILPERQPPTRSRLSFDSPRGHIEVEWDPYDGHGLMRYVVLPKGNWQVSFWAEPQRDSMKFASNYAWQPAAIQTACKNLEYQVTELIGTTATPVIIKLAKINKRSLGGMGDTERVKAAVTPGELMRSFDVAAVPARLAESAIRVVVGRVKRKAVRLATRKLKDVVCQELVGGTTKLLPRTCALIDSVDLRSLSTAASQVAGAMARDVVDLVAVELVADDKLRELVALGAGVVDQLHRQHDVSVAEIQARFLQIAQVLFELKLNEHGATSALCSAQLALTLVAYCQSSSQCTPSFLHDVVAAPATYFDVGQCGVKYHLDTVTVARVDAVIADGRAVFDTALAVTTADRMAATVRASFRLVEIIACHLPENSACRRAGQLIEVGTAIADRDLSALLGAASEVLAASAVHWKERHRKLLSLFFSFVDAGLAIGSDEPEEIARAQVQVERALDVFLDSSANRDGRDGDLIVSLFTGLRVTGGVSRDSDNHHEFHGPLALPLGISLDYLCREDSAHAGKSRGLHLEIGALDLGNYLRIDNDAEAEEIRWTDVASLSLGVGYFRGDDDMPWMLGLSAGLAPGASAPKMGVADRGWVGFVALHFGLYMPLIDLN